MHEFCVSLLWGDNECVHLYLETLFHTDYIQKYCEKMSKFEVNWLKIVEQRLWVKTLKWKSQEIVFCFPRFMSNLFFQCLAYDLSFEKWYEPFQCLFKKFYGFSIYEFYESCVSLELPILKILVPILLNDIFLLFSRLV